MTEEQGDLSRAAGTPTGVDCLQMQPQLVLENIAGGVNNAEHEVRQPDDDGKIVDWRNCITRENRIQACQHIMAKLSSKFQIRSLISLAYRFYLRFALRIIPNGTGGKFVPEDERIRDPLIYSGR